MVRHSPSPEVPQTGDKALGATVIAFLALLAAFYVGDDDPFTTKELVEGLLGAAIGSGLTGGVTYAVKNRRR